MMREEFLQAMDRLCSEFGLRFTEQRRRQADVWFKSFGDLPAETVSAAFERLADRLQHFPKKSDVREALQSVRASKWQGASIRPCDLCDRPGWPAMPSGLCRMFPTRDGLVSAGIAAGRRDLRFNPTNVRVFRCPRCSNGAQYERFPMLDERDCAPGALADMMRYHRAPSVAEGSQQENAA